MVRVAGGSGRDRGTPDDRGAGLVVFRANGQAGGDRAVGHAVDRWQYGDPARPDNPSAEAWAALMRALLCRRGAEQMLGDADEAVRRFAAESFVTPTPVLQQGIARILCGDLDGGDTCLEDAVSVGEQIGSTEHVAVGLCERSLVAMARSQWDRAESSPTGQTPFCAGPGSRKATRRPWSARCEPVQPCTGQTSPQYTRNSPELSGYGTC